MNNTPQQNNIDLIGAPAIKIKIDKSQIDTKTVAIFLPGVSGGALSEKYTPLTKTCLEHGFDIARIEAWVNTDDLENQTMRAIHDHVDNVVSFLQKKGYEIFIAIGKSFGGSIFLTINDPRISKMILWAPAISIQKKSNLNESLDKKLSSFSSALDIAVDANFLSAIKTPIRIIHGSADVSVPLSNSQKLIDSLPNAEMVIIDSMGHSPETGAQNKELLTKTIQFI